jgi:VanZ family protein
MRKKAFTLIVLLCMACIFWFSSKPADESSEMSMEVGKLVATVAVPGYEEWSEEEQYGLAERIDYPVRKMAHGTEYAILAMLCMGMYGAYGKSGWHRRLWSFFTAAGYAATDEFHQLFVPGRSGRITDVGIDSLGAMVGILLLVLVGVWWQKKNKKN